MFRIRFRRRTTTPAPLAEPTALTTVRRILTSHLGLSDAEAAAIDISCGIAASKHFRTLHPDQHPAQVPAVFHGHAKTVCAYTPDQVADLLPVIADTVEKHRWKALTKKAASLSDQLAALIPDTAE